MVNFLNTAAACLGVESIVIKAENRLVIISPFIKIPKLLFERLTYASDNVVVPPKAKSNI